MTEPGAAAADAAERRRRPRRPARSRASAGWRTRRRIAIAPRSWPRRRRRVAASAARGLALAAIVAVVGAVAITVLGGVLTLTAGLLVVAAIIGWAIGMGPARSAAGRHRRRPAAHRLAVALALGAVVLGQVGLWLYARTEGGVLPLVDYLGEVFGPLVPVAGVRRGGRRLGGRAMTGEPATTCVPPARPRPTTRAVVDVVDEWWGGRRMRALLPRLWFQHFTGTSWVAEDADGPARSGFLVGFVSPDHPDRGLHPHGRHEPEPPAARPRPGALRAVLRGRRGRAARDG